LLHSGKDVFGRRSVFENALLSNGASPVDGASSESRTALENGLRLEIYALGVHFESKIGGQTVTRAIMDRAQEKPGVM
jgi:hypothetical protein